MISNFKRGVLSSVLLVGESILKKMVGLISTLILARVLLPEDFGIIAIATLVIGFMNVLSRTGSQQYLLKVEHLDAEITNTSFTINLILKGAIAFAIAISAIFISEYYDDRRLVPVILVMTVVFMVRALNNPGLAFLKREQNYTQIVKVTLGAKIVSVGVAVYAAITLQNYWALIYGQATSATLMLIGSYFIHPHRPKLTLCNAREQWQFSGWMIPQSIFGYVRTQLDTFIVSSSFGGSQLGSYHTMKYIAYIPCAHILMPIMQPFLVELRKSRTAPDYFAKQFNASFILIMLLAAPITSIVFFHHETVTAVLLGKNWVQYSSLLGAFGLLMPAYVMFHQSMQVFIIHGKTKHIFIYECIAFVILYSALFTVGFDDIALFTNIRVSVENIICTILLTYTTIKYTSFRNTVALFLSFIPISIAAYFAVVASQFVANVAEQVFIKLTIITATCFIVFYATVLVFHVLGFRRLKEWHYLEGLAMRILKSVL